MRAAGVGVILFLGLVALLAGSERSETGPPALPGRAVWLAIEGPIGPATEDYIRRSLADAAEKEAPVVIIQMDTPGGLDTSMRGIIRGILDSPVPVAVYIAPEGARGASAGTYILYAAHIAAMAPATSVGAATPVQIGGGGSGADIRSPPGQARAAEEGSASEPEPEPEPEPEEADGEEEARPDAMERKIISDAVAYIRGLAELRGRNAEWAEEAVREGVSLTSAEALELNVIDILVGDLEALLTEMDGRTVHVLQEEQVLATLGLEIERVEPDWRTRLLSILTNPNIAFILLLLGVYGIILEFANPGALIPGITGAICLLLALFAFQLLPINYAGLALILLGLVLMIAEAFAPSFGALGVGGVIAFLLGSIILFDTEIPGFELYLSVILGFAAASVFILIFVVAMAVKAWHRPVVSGREGLIRATGVALEDFASSGRIRVAGESWKARTLQPVRKDQAVQVTRVEGLVLQIEPIENPQPKKDPP
jgi:membrane-bound serine protease (ClpP class)